MVLLALHLHDVAAGHEALEGVGAVFGGNGLGCDFAVHIHGTHFDAGKLLFAAVEAAVVISVLKYGAADAGAQRNADHGIAFFTAGHHDGGHSVFAAVGALLKQVDFLNGAFGGNGKQGAVIGQHGA